MLFAVKIQFRLLHQLQKLHNRENKKINNTNFVMSVIVHFQGAAIVYKSDILDIIYTFLIVQIYILHCLKKCFFVLMNYCLNNCDFSYD